MIRFWARGGHWCFRHGFRSGGWKLRGSGTGPIPFRSHASFDVKVFLDSVSFNFF